MAIGQLANFGDGARLLLQKNLAGHLLDLRVRERDADGEAVHHLLQQRHLGQGALPRPDDHDLAVELL